VAMADVVLGSEIQVRYLLPSITLWVFLVAFMGSSFLGDLVATVARGVLLVSSRTLGLLKSISEARR
jgi:hypothetical protein